MITHVPRVVDKQKIARIILPARCHPRGAAAITDTLRPVVAEWIRAASDWPDLALGETRCLIFDTTLPSGAPGCVRLWFESDTPLLYDTPSGGLRPNAAMWARDHGLLLSLDGESYNGYLAFAGPQDADRIATLVAGILVSMGGYRGLSPIVATIAHTSRCDTQPTLDAFSDDEVARAFRSEGFATEWVMAPCGNHRTDPPAFYARKRGTESVIQMMDEVADFRLYRRMRFDTSVPMPPQEAEEHRRRGELPAEGEARLGISGIHSCIGGVTRTWLLELVRDWDRMFSDPTHGVRFGRRPAAGAPASKTVH